MTDNSWKTKWTKDEIKAMLLEQFDAFSQLKPGLERAQLAEVERAIPLPHAVTIAIASKKSGF